MTAADKTQTKVQAWSSLVLHCRRSSFYPSRAPPWGLETGEWCRCRSSSLTPPASLHSHGSRPHPTRHRCVHDALVVQPYLCPSPRDSQNQSPCRSVSPVSPLRRGRDTSVNICVCTAGHLRAACPVRPSRRDSTTVSADYNHSTSFGIPITINSDEGRIETIAMINSGAAGNFIDISFANSHNLPLISCESWVAVAALDGRPLGSGRIKYLTPEL